MIIVDALEAIMTTRAMRRYTDQAVSDDDIVTCLHAAQQAPSGGNVQPQQYVVVQDADARAALGALYRTAFDRYERSLPEPSAFPDEAQAAAWKRTRDASRHLADHIADAPIIIHNLRLLFPFWVGKPSSTPTRYMSDRNYA